MKRMLRGAALAASCLLASGCLDMIIPSHEAGSGGGDMAVKTASGTPLYDLGQMLAADPNLYAKTHLLSVSFDPKYDTPAVLRSYGGAYTGNYTKEKFQHWDFAAPPPAELDKVLNFFLVGEKIMLVDMPGYGYVITRHDLDVFQAGDILEPAPEIERVVQGKGADLSALLHQLLDQVRADKTVTAGYQYLRHVLTSFTASLLIRDFPHAASVW